MKKILQNIKFVMFVDLLKETIFYHTYKLFAIDTKFWKLFSENFLKNY